jgi:calcineurin-like phosphoesterase
MPAIFPIAKGPVSIHGAIIDIDPGTGKATRIERVARRFTEAS